MQRAAWCDISTAHLATKQLLSFNVLQSTGPKFVKHDSRGHSFEFYLLCIVRTTMYNEGEWRGVYVDFQAPPLTADLWLKHLRIFKA